MVKQGKVFASLLVEGVGRVHLTACQNEADDCQVVVIKEAEIKKKNT